MEIGTKIYIVCLAILLCFLVLGVHEGLRKSQRESQIDKINNMLTYVEDKQIYEARIELSNEVRKLWKIGPNTDKDLRETIEKCLPYLDSEDRLYYKLGFYEAMK